MALESGSYLADLNTANPAGTDPKSQGDDHIRLLKSVLKNSFAGFPGAVVVTGAEAQGATVDDYVVTVSPAPAAYSASTVVVFKATHANTGAATLRFNALAAKALKAVDGGALEAGDIENGALCAAFYDGTDFLLVSGNDRAARGGDSYTGAHDFTGATARVATQGAADNSTKAASTAYVDAADALKADLSGATYTGAHDFTAGDAQVATAAPGTNDTTAASTAFATQLAFQTALPVQTGEGGKYLRTDGVAASWQSLANLAVAKSSNYTVAVADAARHFVLSSSATLSLPPAASVGDGFMIYIRNDGAGIWTIDPNGAETVNGRASIRIYGEEGFTLICDGAEWRTFGRDRDVLIARTVIGAPVATVDFTSGFDDSEFVAFDIKAFDISCSAGSSFLRAQFKKLGVYATSGYANTNGEGGILPTSAIALSIASGGAYGAANKLTAMIGIHNPFSVGPNAQIAEVIAGGLGTDNGRNEASQSTAAALEGLRIMFSSGNVDSGVINFYGKR